MKTQTSLLVYFSSPRSQERSGALKENEAIAKESATPTMPPRKRAAAKGTATRQKPATRSAVATNESAGLIKNDNEETPKETHKSFFTSPATIASPIPTVETPQAESETAQEAQPSPANIRTRRRAKTPLGVPSPIRINRGRLAPKTGARNGQPPLNPLIPQLQPPPTTPGPATGAKTGPPLLEPPRSRNRNTSTSPAPSNDGSTTQSASKVKTNGHTTQLERNIDNVVFGDAIFPAWYSSQHVKDIVGKDVAEKREMLGRLYVCRHCFKYSTEIMAYTGHLKVCPRRKGGKWAMIPGTKIYKHGDSGWGIWELDGEVDTLYCQNLCLFAKLFLETKSVFFDVTCFLYYLLVFTDPTTGESHVCGFFSKEKMSWDNNNLACILVFPSWQRKGLGSLLIGISYAISRHERILGGPEKPLSDLGKLGYMKFWSVEIARYLLEVNMFEKREITVEDVSMRTWILKEDVLDALVWMDVVTEKVERGKKAVVIDIEGVRMWADKTKTALVPVIDPEGFCGSFRCRDPLEEDVDEEMGE